MQHYLITLKEQEKLKKALATLKKGDSLLVVYPTNEDQVSIELINSINTAAGTVEFIEYKSYTNDSVANMAYTVGYLMGKFQDLTILTDNPVIKQFSAEGGEKKTRRRSAQKPADTIEDPKTPKMPAEAKTNEKEMSEEPFMPEPVAEIKEEAKEFKGSASYKRLNPYKKKQKVVQPADDFEKNYAAFEEYLKTLKTKQFDPSLYTGTIIKAVKNAEKEKSDIAEALTVWCNPATGKKLAALFKDKVDKIKEYVSKIEE